MRKFIVSLALVSIILIAMVVPVNASNFDTIQYQVGTGTQVYKLGLGNFYDDIGTVTVSSDSTNLYVQFDTDTGWVMSITYLGVASGSDFDAALDKFPNPPGPGQIASQTGVGYYGEKHTLSSATSDIYTIPLSIFTDINSDNWLVIAGIADISGTSSGTAWATGTGEPPSNPTPELPAGILLGLGLAGVGSFVLIKRRSRATI
jgi:hypothetical protein